MSLIEIIYAVLITLSGIRITSLGSIFDNLLPQRNQIDWRGSHDYLVTHIQLGTVNFTEKRCGLHKFQAIVIA